MYTHIHISTCGALECTMWMLEIISCKSAHKSLQGLNQQTVALISGFSTDTVQLMQSIYLHLICVG